MKLSIFVLLVFMLLIIVAAYGTGLIIREVRADNIDAGDLISSYDNLEVAYGQSSTLGRYMSYRMEYQD